jgi:hypothetical protein
MKSIISKMIMAAYGYYNISMTSLVSYLPCVKIVSSKIVDVGAI